MTKVFEMSVLEQIELAVQSHYRFDDTIYEALAVMIFNGRRYTTVTKTDGPAHTRVAVDRTAVLEALDYLARDVERAKAALTVGPVGERPQAPAVPSKPSRAADPLTERAMVYATRHLAEELLHRLSDVDFFQDEAGRDYRAERVTETVRDLLDIAARIERFVVADCLRVAAIGHRHASFLDQALALVAEAETAERNEAAVTKRRKKGRPARHSPAEAFLGRAAE
ncbi:hypothetical protein [Magnetospirillum molischianum]|uniref:Uncharacterized protein n=1 Tax=Magnetospirillum molischianum DSM 120 TaxID=1150626 RepID=H8FVR6_MAGML|nr:hypothetical protein [Magnetospirillum molischianum]CCG42454.1 hypothetical protein PHAMO_40015 [Magnetospirillum molischianum DSM 120]